MNGIRKAFDKLIDGVKPELARIFVFCALILVLYRFVCAGKGYKLFFKPFLGLTSDSFLGMGQGGWKGVSTFVLMMVVPVLWAWLIDGKKPVEIGLGLGEVKKGIKWSTIFLGVMTVVVFAAGFSSTFSDKYPLEPRAADSVQTFFSYQLMMLMYFLGWEFFFRGYMLFSLHRYIGNTAIFVQMIPFAVLHGSKPLPEALGSILVGVILGYFAIATRSFVYCAILHFIIAMTMDLSAIFQKSVLAM